MNLEQCYNAFQGDYAGTVNRLMKPEFVKRLLLKFLTDSSMEELEKALEAQNPQEAFRAVHTLKGLSLNLGFTPLSQDAVNLTEKLRGGELAGTEELYKKLQGSYQMTVDAIRQLDAE